MNFLKDILAALFGAIFGAAKDAVNDYRRDAELKTSGYNQAQIDAIREREVAWKRAVDIQAAPDPETIDETLRDL